MTCTSTGLFIFDYTSKTDLFEFEYSSKTDSILFDYNSKTDLFLFCVKDNEITTYVYAIDSDLQYAIDSSGVRATAI